MSEDCIQLSIHPYGLPPNYLLHSMVRYMKLTSSWCQMYNDGTDMGTPESSNFNSCISNTTTIIIKLVWRSSNTLDLYSWGAQIQFWPGPPLSQLRSFVPFFCPSTQMSRLGHALFLPYAFQIILQLDAVSPRYWQCCKINHKIITGLTILPLSKNYKFQLR